MTYNKINSDRSEGFVAIFSVLVIMGILTLLTIGFSNITRQAQKRALDDHLSNQAFYAAESGVNIAKAGDLTVDKTDCAPPSVGDYDIDAAQNISVSCLLVDSTVKDILDSGVPDIGNGDPVVREVYATDPIVTMKVEWDSVNKTDPIIDLGTSTTDSPRLLPNSEWKDSTGKNGVGVLRVDLVPVGEAYNRSSSVTGGYTFYLYPSMNVASSQATLSRGSGDQGTVLVGQCNSGVGSEGHRCNSNITFNPGPEQNFFLRLSSYYNPVGTRITGVDTNNDPVEFERTQAVIDSTGKANDIYRRIQVRVPIDPIVNNPHVPFAVFGGNEICKLLTISDTTISNTCIGEENVVLGATSIPSGGANGNATIGTCLPSEPPNCMDDPQSPTAPQFDFNQSFPNMSDNDNPSLVTNCTWIWGDGTQNTYPASNAACQYGRRVNHTFPDTSAQILATNGAQGCRRYTVRLIMRFQPSSGIPDQVDIRRAESPRGQANDNPSGICFGKWVNYTP